MAPKSSFDYFLEDWKKKQEAKGRKFPGGLKDIVNVCTDEWKKMTSQQKGPYDKMAKDGKVRGQIQHETLYSSQGVPLAFIEREERRKLDFQETMNDYIKNTFNMAVDNDSLASQRFHFIHVNWYCQERQLDGTLDYYPAEFAVSAFSLRHGLEEEYCELVKLKLPLGYACEIAQHSDTSHRIPPEPPGGETDFLKMYEKLMKILNPETQFGRELPPLYTTKSCGFAVPGLLRRMARASGESDDKFRIYSLETLFLHLRNAAAQMVGAVGFPAVTLADAEIEKDYFAYQPDLACSFHKQADAAVVHCSLSLVKRWVFIMCDHCCQNLGIRMIPGQHCPVKRGNAGFVNVNERLATLAIEPSNVPSMTGVTAKYREETSARSYKEEQQRRNKSNYLTIIDHSKVSTNASETPAVVPSDCNHENGNKSDGYSSKVAKWGKPRRGADTKSYATVGEASDQVPEMDDANFPAMGGKGASTKRTSQGQSGYVRRGRGSQMNG